MCRCLMAIQRHITVLMQLNLMIIFSVRNTRLIYKEKLKIRLIKVNNPKILVIIKLKLNNNHNNRSNKCKNTSVVPTIQ